MRNLLAAILSLACAGALAAQTSDLDIRKTPNGGSAPSTFSIGPRVSNYSTDLREAFTPMKTGRQSSFGLIGGYRSGAFVLDFLYDHDPENGIGVTNLIVDTGNYSRNRGELTVGYAAAPVLDLQGGVRIDHTRVGGIVILGNPVATDLDVDHQALTAGLRFHTEPNPVGFYALARAFVGSAKLDFGDGNGSVNSDTSGYRGEAALDIRLGDSTWTVQPGYEYDHFETKDYGVRMNTNRFFLNFVYHSR